MVTQAQDQDLYQAKQLWKICFGDPDPYVNFYFQSRYQKEYTFCIHSQQELVSAAQFFPYGLGFHGYPTLLPAVYVLGVCTHPLHRGKGYANRILQHGLDAARRKGAALAALIPQEESLFSLYRHYGFAESFDVETALLPVEDFQTPPLLHSQIYSHTPSAFEGLYQFYDQWYRSRPVALIKNREDFRFALEDLFMSGGQVFVCGDPDRPQGFAAVQFEAPFTVKEILFHHEAVRYSLIHAILQASPAQSQGLHVVYPTGLGASHDKPTPLGMARVLNPSVFLQACIERQEKQADLHMSIKINDPFIRDNSGIYHIRSGSLSFSPQGEKPYDLELDIQAFTQLVLGYRVPEQPTFIFEHSGPGPYANLLMN